MNAVNLNCDLVRALGIDPKDCSRVAMIIERGEMPRLQVTRLVKNADGLQTAVEMLRLKPAADDPPVDADGRPEPVVTYLGEVQRLRMQPGDTLVLSCDAHISDETGERIRDHMRAMIGGDHKVLVLGRGMKVGVLGQQQHELSSHGEQDHFAEYGPTILPRA